MIYQSVSRVVNKILLFSETVIYFERYTFTNQRRQYTYAKPFLLSSTMKYILRENKNRFRAVTLAFWIQTFTTGLRV